MILNSKVGAHTRLPEHKFHRYIARTHLKTHIPLSSAHSRALCQPMSTNHVCALTHLAFAGVCIQPQKSPSSPMYLTHGWIQVPFKTSCHTQVLPAAWHDVPLGSGQVRRSAPTPCTTCESWGDCLVAHGHLAAHGGMQTMNAWACMACTWARGHHATQTACRCKHSPCRVSLGHASTVHASSCEIMGASWNPCCHAWPRMHHVLFACIM